MDNFEYEYVYDILDEPGESQDFFDDSNDDSDPKQPKVKDAKITSWL